MADEQLVKVPFRIHTTEGVLEASVQTTEGPIEVISVVGAARGLEDALIGVAARKAEAMGAPVTCRRGCDACCHHLVPLSAAEAHALARMVEAMPPERRAETERRFELAKQRAEEAGLLGALEATLDGAPFDRHREWFAAYVACPFLDGGSCAVYDDRPLACREHLVSSDPAACRSTVPGQVKSVPLLGRLARALTGLSAEVWPDAPERIPLPLALDWARRHAAEASVTRSGVALLERLLGRL